MAKSDPTVGSERTASSSEKGRSGTEQPHEARPVFEASDFAGDRKFEDNPGKPDPSTIAQVEVTD